MGQDLIGREKRQKGSAKKERDIVQKQPPEDSAVAPETNVEDDESSSESKDEVIAPDGVPYTKKEEPPLF